MSVFVHAPSIKTDHAGGGGQKMSNSVHVVVECPLMYKWCKEFIELSCYFDFIGT